MAMGAARAYGAAPVVTNIAMFPSVSVAYTNYTQGFNDGANYSRLAITHTGTNGAIVFDSQSSGTAGQPRPFDFPGTAFSGPGTLRPYRFLLTNVVVQNAAVGNVDIWSVPAGYRAILAGGYATSTNTAGSLMGITVKTNGTYYWLGSPSASGPSTNVTVALGALTSYVFDGGETISVTNNAQGLYAIATIRYWPDTMTPRSYKNLNLTTGTNLIYTCPAGMRASAVDATLRTDNLLGNFYPSTTGMKFEAFFVPNGASLGLAARVQSRIIASSSASLTFSLPEFHPGDSYYNATDSAIAGQISWISVIEYPVW